VTERERREGTVMEGKLFALEGRESEGDEEDHQRVPASPQPTSMPCHAMPCLAWVMQRMHCVQCGSTPFARTANGAFLVALFFFLTRPFIFEENRTILLPAAAQSPCLSDCHRQ